MFPVEKQKRILDTLKAEGSVLVSKLSVDLGVTEETAEIDACRVEHVISKETVDKIKEKLKEL